MNRLGFLEREGRQLDPQMFLDLEAAIERTKKTVPPRFFGYTFLGDAKKGVLIHRPAGRQLGPDFKSKNVINH